MSRLTKAQAKAHAQAEELLQQEVLSLDDREFVINNWMESARHINSAAAAFFTPLGLAYDLAIETDGCKTLIDLCAGIGALSYAAMRHHTVEPFDRVVCVEINPDYAAVGRKIVPEAEWIVASADALPDLGRFDIAIGNPPFGTVCKIAGPRYRGEADLAVIDIASDLADFGAFIIPQMSCPFEYSGRPSYVRRQSDKFERFHKATGIELTTGCGIDCDFYRKEWRGASPSVEIACADFTELRALRLPAQQDLFGEAA